MSERFSTSDRILDSARRLFNEKGYASTSLTEIAADVGISQGNLTYHFRTKRDIVARIEEQVATSMQSRWESHSDAEVAEDYVEHLVFAMRMTWDIRFLLRDYFQFSEDPDWLKNNPNIIADYNELRGLLERIRDGGLFLPKVDVDLDILTRSLWITSRYWLDHLRELEGDSDLTWEQLERGVRHHFALLRHFLRPEASESFEAAISTSLRFMQRFEATPLRVVGLV